jgi:pSer/pThr/pTyr-binding forkhead associated (FHA) protein
VHPQIEVISGAHSRRISLEADRTTVGTAAENDVALEHDPTASHLHAVLERFPAGWCVADLGSSNGTWVNGERIWSAHRLRHGDEIRVGQTRVIFRDPVAAGGSVTEVEVTQAAVKQHVANLYDKFGVGGDRSNRRSRLANEALRRGAVSLTELRASAD